MLRIAYGGGVFVELFLDGLAVGKQGTWLNLAPEDVVKGITRNIQFSYRAKTFHWHRIC